MRKLLVFLIFSFAFGQINWEIEIVDTAGSSVGLYNALAIDTNNIPHIVYSNIDDAGISTNFIIHTFQDGSIWQKEIVDSGHILPPSGFSSPYHGISVVIDKNNQLHLSYFRYDSLTNSTQLCYGYRSSPGWTIMVLDSFSGYTLYSRAFSTSIALDTTDFPGIAYCYLNYNDSLQYIKLFHYNGFNWNAYIINDACDNWDYGPSLEFDQQNQPHIAFYQEGPGNGNDSLKYTYYDTPTNNWVFVYFMAIDYLNSHASLSLALDNQDYPRIAYSNYYLIYAWWNGSTWSTDYITDIGTWEIEIDLELDNLQNPHIVYTEEFNFKVNYCYKNAVWHIYQSLDNTGYTLEDISFELDRFGKRHISYELDWLLKYALGTFVGIAENDEGYWIQDTKCRLKILPSISYGILNIECTIPVQDVVDLAIYNAGGAKIKSIKQKNYLPGSYQQRINISDLASGIYFVVLKQNNEQVSRKFLLIK